MSDDVSPTARALLALEVIQSAPGISGERLAARLRVTDRAARRYVGILREAGIPVESVSGRYGGYRLGRGARIPPLMFTTAEALGLVMAVLQGWHGSVEEDHPAAVALAKIVRVLPAAAAEPAEAMRRVRAQNPSDAASMPDPELTTTAVRACEARRTIRLSYQSTPTREPWEASVDPWAVVVRHGRWYLLCWSHAVRAERVLRLDRVRSVEITDDRFERPADLDAVRSVEEHMAQGWAHEVQVRIEGPMEQVAWCLPRALGVLRADGPDACTLRGSTDEPDWYAAQLAAIPAPFRIERGDEVRAAVRELAERLGTSAR